MSGVLAGFAVLVAVIGVGYLVGRMRVLGAEGPAVLSRLAFYVGTPALLFVTLSRADVGGVLSSALLVAGLSNGFVALLYVLTARLLWRRPAPEVTVGALSASYVNAGNLGIAIAVYVLGDATIVAPVLLLQLLVMSPIALAVLDLASGAGGRSLLRVVSQPLRIPVTVGSLLGILLSATGGQLPPLVMRPIELVAATAVPVSLLAYGMSLHGSPLPATGDTRRDVYLAVALKNVVHPAAAYLVGAFVVGLRGAPLLAVTVMAALPTAQNIFVYAVTFGRGTTLARDAVLLTTLLSAPLLVLVAALLSPGG